MKPRRLILAAVLVVLLVPLVAVSAQMLHAPTQPGEPVIVAKARWLWLLFTGIQVCW
jgi:Flp pilus assembly protein CpaB